MKIFTFEEKLQLSKWYFNGKSAKDIFALYCSKYGKKRGIEPSRTGIVYPCEKFEKTGCIHGSCAKCNGRDGRAWKRVMSDERELNEIMVCAAAELELSMRDIAIELEIPQRTVANILRRNGYSIMSLIDEESKDETQLEKASPEKLQIIKWYCQGKTLLDITNLYNENFKQIDEIKGEILKTILHYEKYGCLRDCEKCSKKIDKNRLTLKIKDVEGLIIKQIKELETNDTKKDLPPTEPDIKKIKLECCVETTVLASASDRIKDSKCSDFAKRSETSRKNNMIVKESEEKIEFVAVEPTLEIIVAEQTNKRKKKKISS